MRAKGFGVGDDFLRPGNNAIGFLRLVLASIVLFYHSFILRGVEAPGHMEALLAVSGFFFLSGMLITQSFLHSGDLKDFIWRRALRIFPGFWGCLILSAFVIAPIGFALQHQTFPASDANSYVVHGMPMFGRHESVGDLFKSNPFGNTMNGSLWTLPLEFFCYLAAGFFGFLGLLKRRWPILVIAAILLTWHVFPSTQLPAIPHMPQGLTRWNVLEPYLMFALGAAAHLFRERIQLPWWIGPLAVAVVLFLFCYESASPGFQMASRAVRVFALPAALVWLATVIPLRNFDRRRDLSYGTYIYAFPIQQLLIVAGVAGAWPLLALSFPLTLFVAFLSWSFIEAPALRLKKLLARRPIPHLPEAT